MNVLYLLIGGNLGNRIQNLAMARSFIEKDIGTILNTSSIYETASWGISDQPFFLNQVLLLETSLSAEITMQSILSIEKKIGRVRTEKNASRIIDIDILFFNDEIINHSQLIIPHPQIQNRKFVLIPLQEIAPDFEHPVLKQTIKKILSTTKDTLEVKPLYDL